MTDSASLLRVASTHTDSLGKDAHSSCALVLIMTGTHHRPFPRLIEWADRFAHDHPDTQVYVQYGSSCPPRIAHGVESLAYDEMERMEGYVDAVVTQGGPSLAMEWLRRGVRPIVVPRDPALGEHIDAHQQLFASFLSDHAYARIATTYAAMEQAVLDQLAGKQDHMHGDLPDTGQSVARFSALVDQVVQKKKRQ